MNRIVRLFAILFFKNSSYEGFFNLKMLTQQFCKEGHGRVLVIMNLFETN